MNQRKYKTRLQKEALQGISEVIFKIVQIGYKQDHYALLSSVLVDVMDKFNVKLCTVKKWYAVTLTAPEALALRMLSNIVGDHTSYVGSQLHRIANEVHQQYQ